MFSDNLRAVCLAAALSIIGSPLLRADENKNFFSLPAAVPGDVFLFVAERGNPERVFLNDYWKEVYAALKASGIGEDVLSLISSLLGEEQIEEMNRLHARADELIRGVDWDKLGEGEFVFAERLPKAIVRGAGVNVGAPDCLWMFRGEKAAENYEGLTAIAKALADEANKLIGRDLIRTDDDVKKGCRQCCLYVSDENNTQLFSVNVGLRNDVILISTGHDIFAEAIDLLDGKNKSSSLTSLPRFQKAFAQLPAPEDSMFYFDMTNLVGSFTGIVKSVERQIRKDGDRYVNAALTPESRRLNGQAVAAYQAKDHKKALELIQQAYEHAPTDSLVMYNLACFHALDGRKDEALDWLTKAVDGGFYGPKQISTDPDLETLRSDDRYLAALAKARKMLEGETVNANDASPTPIVVMNRVMDILDTFESVANVEFTEGYSTRCSTIASLSPDAKNSPLHKVLTSQKNISDFERFLPQETSEFSVSSMVDWLTLYAFVEDTVKTVAPDSEQVWSQWEEIQKAIGLDLREDLLGWLGDRVISATIQVENQSAQVFFLAVKNEEKAREMIGKGLGFLRQQIQEQAAQNPMLGMLNVTTQPATHESLEGFTRIQMAISPQPNVFGIKDGYLIVGTSEQAVLKCLATGRNEHPNIRKNERLMKEMLLPTGDVVAINYNDQRSLGREMAEMVQVVSMIGGMASMAVPNPTAQRVISKCVQILGKLVPVLQKIDFYKSSSSYTTFDGQHWRTESVTHYQSPDERKTDSPL